MDFQRVHAAGHPKRRDLHVPNNSQKSPEALCPLCPYRCIALSTLSYPSEVDVRTRQPRVIWRATYKLTVPLVSNPADSLTIHTIRRTCPRVQFVRNEKPHYGIGIARPSQHTIVL